jgi:subtilisin family serine protease
MRVVRRPVLAAAVLALVVGAALPALAFASGGERARVIVTLHAGHEPAGTGADLARRHGGRLGFVYEHALRGFVLDIPAGARAALARDRRVAAVEDDQVVTAYEVPTGVQRINAHLRPSAGIGTGRAVDVDIAVLDSGVDGAHPDLTVVGGVDCSGGSPMRAKCREGTYADGNGHGTHVAGSAAARDDGRGVVGVAPGARVHAVKVLEDRGSGYTSWIIAGIDWVTARAATIEVANMSLGCECTSAAQDDAIRRSVQAGVVYVVAAGNSAKDARTFNPANHPDVIATSAMADFDGKAGGGAAATCRSDVDDTFADFSNYGSVVDIAAPGVCITSTWPGGGYSTISGTSMASPHAAGAAALYIVEHGVPRSSTRAATVRQGLQSSSWSVAQSHACGFTGGRSGERMLLLAAC